MTSNYAVRGLRGATTITENTKEAIVDGTKTLLQVLLSQNNCSEADICSIFFSTTHDVNAVFPAVAARELGLQNTPLLCLNEIDVPDSLKLCIRILIHINTTKSQSEMKHVYLNNAKQLRPEFGIDP